MGFDIKAQGGVQGLCRKLGREGKLCPTPAKPGPASLTSACCLRSCRAAKFCSAGCTRLILISISRSMER